VFLGAIFPKLNAKYAYNIDTGFFIFFCILILLKQVLFLVWYYRIKKKRKRIREEKFELNPDIFTSQKSIANNQRPAVLKFLNIWKHKKANLKNHTEVKIQQNETIL
jgi:hypothetical protein